MVLLVWLSPPEIKLKPVKFLNTFSFLLVIPDDFMANGLTCWSKNKLTQEKIHILKNENVYFFLCELKHGAQTETWNFWQVNVLLEPVHVGGVGGQYKYAHVDCRLYCRVLRTRSMFKADAFAVSLLF